jgi:hypothetical protein
MYLPDIFAQLGGAQSFSLEYAYLKGLIRFQIQSLEKIRETKKNLAILYWFKHTLISKTSKHPSLHLFMKAVNGYLQLPYTILYARAVTG